MSIRVSIELGLTPSAAFDQFVDELSSGLVRLGLELIPGRNGRVSKGATELGRVLGWDPGKQINLEWQSTDWDPKTTTRIDARFEPAMDGTRVTVEYHDPSRLVNNDSNELTGWFAGEVIAPLLVAVSPGRFGDWLTDRRARRPSGAQARTTYRDPTYHRPNFKAILNKLKLTPEDRLLEVGCGGGALLNEALRSGCKAVGIDHSSEMVKLAQESNSAAVRDQRLDIREAKADHIPYPDDSFTCAVMTGVFGFLDDPVKVMGEIYRTLKKDGRLIVFTGSPKTRGTIAAPEPMASRLHFHEDEELKQYAMKVGFLDVNVERPDLSIYAREAGVPEEHIGLFKGREGQLLIARKLG